MKSISSEFFLESRSKLFQKKLSVKGGGRGYIVPYIGGGEYLEEGGGHQPHPPQGVAGVPVVIQPKRKTYIFLSRV